jgi:hypothetical protein
LRESVESSFIVFDSIFAFEKRCDKAKLRTPMGDDGQNETLILAVMFDLEFTETCILQRSMMKRFGDELCLVNNVAEARENGNDIFNEELDTVRVAGDEKAVVETLK